MKTLARLGRLTIVALSLLMTARTASAHFLWITIEPPKAGEKAAKIEAFLNETPEPGGPEFLKFVKGVRLTVEGQPLPVSLGEETSNARWVGDLPSMIDATRDLGPLTRGGKTYRLVYSARAQTTTVAIDEKPTGDQLRARLVTKDGKSLVQVLLDGKAVAKARIKVYPEAGEPRELNADDQGLAEIPGLAEGKAALWANWADGTPGETEGIAYSETRYYASLTVCPKPAPASDAPSTAFADLPAPAVNSFGGAVLGDWLYVYSGHVGKTHQYSTETTSRHFRRLNLKDRTTWEDLPMSRDVQGVALVSDGKSLYRVGGMSARNKPDTEHDLHSVADFARFDPETRTWTDLPSLLEPRSTHDAVVIGRKVYAVGGWHMKGETEQATYVEHAEVFDLDHPETGWAKLDQPFQRRALSVAEAGDKLFVLGGLNASMKVERRVDVYDPATGSWGQGPDLPTSARNDGFGTSAFGIGDAVYFSGVAGTVYRLDAEGNAWEALGAWNMPRITHRILPGPDRTLLAVGGNAKGKQVPMIESVPLPQPGLEGKAIANAP